MEVFRENIQDLVNFYNFDLMSFDKSDYYDDFNLYKGDYNIFYLEDPNVSITSCVIYNKRIIHFRYISFMEIVTKYIYYQLLHNRRLSDDLIEDILLEIETVTDFLSSEINDMIIHAKDRADRHIRNHVRDEERDHLIQMFRNSYRTLFDVDIIRQMIRHKLYIFTKSKELFFMIDVNVINHNILFNFQSPHEIDNCIDYFGYDFQHIISYCYPKYYPFNKHSNLSFGDTISTIKNLINKNVCLSELEEIKKQIEYNMIFIEENTEFTKIERNIIKQEVNNLMQKKNTIETEIKKVKKNINNPNTTYPFYFIYNDIRDYFDSNQTKTNHLEFLDNDLHEFHTVIRNAENHKKRYLLTLKKNIEFIEQNFNNQYFVDSKLQQRYIYTKLLDFQTEYITEQIRYEQFVEIIKTVLFDKKVFKYQITLNNLSHLLTKELEYFYNIQKLKIENYITNGKIIYIQQKHFLVDDNNIKEQFNEEISNYQEKIKKSNVKIRTLKNQLNVILNKLDDVYNELLNSEPDTTFSIPDLTHIEADAGGNDANIGKFLDL